MKPPPSEKTYHLLFEIGIIVKAIIAAGEILFGLLFYFVSAPTINSFVLFFLGDEASERPRDLLWNYAILGFQGLIGNAQPFWAFIFLSHGLVKIFLIVALLKNKLWAYPASAVVFSLFVIYQTYTFVYAPSLFLALFNGFDIVVIALIIHEYQHKSVTK